MKITSNKFLEKYEDITIQKVIDQIKEALLYLITIRENIDIRR